MKTPQEQADKINSQLAETLFAHTKADIVDFTTTLKQENPLPELIAVAQAAEKLVKATGHAEQFNYNEVLVDALIALRATGKVEL